MLGQRREGERPHVEVPGEGRLEVGHRGVGAAQEMGERTELQRGGPQEGGLPGPAVVVGVGLDEVVERGGPDPVVEVHRRLGQAHHEEPPVEVAVALGHGTGGQPRQLRLGLGPFADLARHPRHEGGLSRRGAARVADLEQEAQVLHAALEPPPRQGQAEVERVELGVFGPFEDGGCLGGVGFGIGVAALGPGHQAGPHVAQAQVLGLLDLVGEGVEAHGDAPGRVVVAELEPGVELALEPLQQALAVPRALTEAPGSRWPRRFDGRRRRGRPWPSSGTAGPRRGSRDHRPDEPWPTRRRSAPGAPPEGG